MNILTLIIAGAMLGVSVGLVFITVGKVAGISSIANGALARNPQQWKLAFLLGLVACGGLLFAFFPSSFSQPDLSNSGLIIGGLLVGFGTRISNGCTAGHGICGNARFSKRSILATLTFITTGALTVFVGGVL